MKPHNLVIAAILALSAVFTEVRAQELPYQNPNNSAEVRAEDLLKRLTLKEKCSLMMDLSPAIERLNVPAFAWWSEALHGVGRNGIGTIFPSCIGMAASFNPELLEKVYSAVSDEARAKNTALRRSQTPGRYQGLSFWTPTINIFRDPRWGRGQESYGEDPYLNAVMGGHVVMGLQGPKESKYKKLYACAKHFAVHSGPEKTRHYADIENLSPRDLWETYLPAFKSLVKDYDVKEIMCAYQRYDGEPCCGSTRLLQQILREDWGFSGLVVSDCGAIADFWRDGGHHVSKNEQEASAKGALSGTDVECGSVYKNLPKAVEEGLITEEQIDNNVRRLLKGRFELGDFDADSLVKWTQIPTSVIACKEHKQLALDMARQTIVLLQNKNNILPLRKDASRIMVMGPNAKDSTMLWGIYFGQAQHSITPLEGIEQVLDGKVDYSKACDITTINDTESLFATLKSREGKQGMDAQFWNNTRFEGKPAAEMLCQRPLNFDTGGNTVVAPNVALNNFSARFSATFTAEKTETLVMSLANDDGLRIIVNQDTVYERWRKDRLNYRKRDLKVEQGKTYNIVVEYMQLDDTATLNFDLERNNPLTLDEVVAKAKDKDIIIFVGGISPNLEREEAKVALPGFDNGDRTSIELPEAQRQIIRALKQAGKKVVLVNCSGSAVALTPETETADAIVEAWYPGEQGGRAIADVLFGEYNPSGKLPVTFYKSDKDLMDFNDYSMKNRTYRYLQGEPLYPFGYGLSYTTFALGKPHYDKKAQNVCLQVENTGTRAGAEVVQIYVKDPKDTEGPKKTLRAFQRIELQAGEKRNVEIALQRKSFELFDTQSNTMRIKKGKYEVFIGTSSDDKDEEKLTVTVK